MANDFSPEYEVKFVEGERITNEILKGMLCDSTTDKDKENEVKSLFDSYSKNLSKNIADSIYCNVDSPLEDGISYVFNLKNDDKETKVLNRDTLFKKRTSSFNIKHFLNGIAVILGVLNSKDERQLILEFAAYVIITIADLVKEGDNIAVLNKAENNVLLALFKNKNGLKRVKKEELLSTLEGDKLSNEAAINRLVDIGCLNSFIEDEVVYISLKEKIVS